MELSLHTYRELASIIRHESGIVLGPDKSYLVRHRLETLVRNQGLESFDGLVTRLKLRSGTALCHEVIDAITVKETRFFRDQGCFDGLLKLVLPTCALTLGKFGQVGGRQRIRIWSAAAATGQEAYSVAMMVREFCAANADGPDETQFSILASDISTNAIQTAKAGRYNSAEVRRGLSDSRLHRHFYQRGERWCVSEPVRRLVQFRTFNLLHPPADLGGGGGAFDLILCRNVLIYFDDATRRKICRGLYTALHDGGWLALGSAESLYGMDVRFETLIQAKSVLYRKPHR
jgi:chemotaxis protein methyltransferase CheR